MIFFTSILSVLVFALISVIVGNLWFRVCKWNESFRCRDYRALAVAIPVTYFLAFLLIGIPKNSEAVSQGIPLPPVTVSKKIVKKKVIPTIKKKKKEKEKEKEEYIEEESSEEYSHD
jgi:hypothetical protein